MDGLQNILDSVYNVDEVADQRSRILAEAIDARLLDGRDVIYQYYKEDRQRFPDEASTRLWMARMLTEQGIGLGEGETDPLS